MRRRTQDAVLVGVAAAAAALFAASPAIVGSDVVHAAAPLTRYAAAIPEGAGADVAVEYDAGGYTEVTLTVEGLAPRTPYAGRARVGGCSPEVSGLAEVFQMSPNPDPERPGDPQYRNPYNELWLDFRTDDEGAAETRVTQKWQFHPTWRPGSVTIHEMSSDRREHSTAGATVACLEVAF